MEFFIRWRAALTPALDDLGHSFLAVSGDRWPARHPPAAPGARPSNPFSAAAAAPADGSSADSRSQILEFFIRWRAALTPALDDLGHSFLAVSGDRWPARHPPAAPGARPSNPFSAAAAAPADGSSADSRSQILEFFIRWRAALTPALDDLGHSFLAVSGDRWPARHPPAAPGARPSNPFSAAAAAPADGSSADSRSQILEFFIRWRAALTPALDDLGHSFLAVSGDRWPARHPPAAPGARPSNPFSAAAAAPADGSSADSRSQILEFFIRWRAALTPALDDLGHSFLAVSGDRWPARHPPAAPGARPSNPFSAAAAAPADGSSADSRSQILEFFIRWRAALTPALDDLGHSFLAVSGDRWPARHPPAAPGARPSNPFSAAAAAPADGSSADSRSQILEFFIRWRAALSKDRKQGDR